jgi:hypothetical protein
MIGDYCRGIPILHLQDTLNTEPTRDFIHQLTAKLFANCSSHINPLVPQIGIYTPDDLTSLYEAYKHKRPKHMLLSPAHRQAAFFSLFFTNIISICLSLTF